MVLHNKWVLHDGVKKFDVGWKFVLKSILVGEDEFSVRNCDLDVNGKVVDSKSVDVLTEIVVSFGVILGGCVLNQVN